ncbi:FAD-binding oxidoreductase [Gemmobacter nectariphilus]|uniref:FAD-binding oxidoreductase n=1 Tax=Gemmobacter nectariphilus TaxID=220343 RepID=UPI00041FBCCF|nr:FAD-binding oxidoreductase [Gemmobacter nectariphilus]
MLDRLRAITGAGNVLTGEDAARYGRDWTGAYSWSPLAVVRPGSTAEVAAVMATAHEARVPVVPVAGNTGLVGGTKAPGALMLSLERMTRIRALKPEARIVVAEAGVVLARLHDAAAEQDLLFPLWFGARGSAMLGGALSTNAGGSNVLRYGSTRGLCLGLEVVLPDGRVLNLMQELHKDNSGYALKDLFIGAEGTLGIITAATMKLVPAPRAHATATLAAPSLAAALSVLNRLQEVTGGLVEAYEFMPGGYMDRLATIRPDLGQPFTPRHEVTILVELGATAPRDTEPRPDGSIPLVDLLEDTLASLMEDGHVLDAVVARTEAQRATMWARREAAAELALTHGPVVDTDVCVPLDRVQDFLTRMPVRLAALDPNATDLTVAHLGDGNLHYTVFPSQDGAELMDAIRAAIEDVVAELNGSFSAEHGIGLSKLSSMRRRKDPLALEMMRAIKAAFDPLNLMNPGKILPDATEETRA